jgi:hypothetical protein
MSDTVYILADIVERLGPATENETRLELEGYTNEDFITKGRRIGTPRLAKELARNYGQIVDWLNSATAQQKEYLGFVGKDWLRIAAFAGRQAEIRHDEFARGESEKAATKHVRGSKADEAMDLVKHTRERLYTALLNVAAGLSVWKARVDAAYATPDTRVPMTDAVDALCTIAEKMLAEPTSGMVIRLARNNITSATIQKWRDLSESARLAKQEADAVAPSPSVSQADIDIWDGIAITLFEQFVDAVEDARRLDPAIPAPSIIGLRNWFGRRSPKSDNQENPKDTSSSTSP